MANELIMIVEDDFVTATYIYNILIESKYKTLPHIATGDEAISSVLKNQPDLILMDIELDGEMDGITASAKIRENNDIPIIFLTSYSQETLLEKAKKEMPYGYLMKPVSQRGLLAAIEMALYKFKIDIQLRESEARFRRLAENSPDMIYRMSLPDGKLEYLSPASYYITGFTPEEFYNGTIDIQKNIPSDFSDYMNQQWKNMVKGDVPPFYEYKIIHKNGEERWLYQRNVLVNDESGSPIAIEGIITDITERKKAEQALLESEIFNRRIIETANEGICVMDCNYVITYLNQKMADLLGYTVEEIKGKSVTEFMFPEDSVDHKQRINERKAGKCGYYERRFVKKDGTVLWTSASTNAILNPDGSYGGSFGMF